MAGKVAVPANIGVARVLSLLTLKVLAAKLFSNVGARAFLLLSIAGPFIPLERLIPYRPRQKLFRARLVLDLLHFFVGGLIMILFVRASYIVLPVISGWAGVHASSISVKNLPGWEQFLIFEASWTFLGYWLHRLEHTWRPLWRLHAVHESSRELDWLSGFRLHPLEPAMFQALTIVPLWFFGMSIPVAITYQLYAYVMAHIQHANISLPLGPLKYVFPSPDFHRWHHARNLDANGQKVWPVPNYGQYPIWDVIFGTFYMPKGKPAAYGYADDVPMDFVGQLAYPFGLHLPILAWKKRFWANHPKLAQRVTELQSRVAPTHEAMEARLAGLCLLPPTAAETLPAPDAARVTLPAE